MNQRLYVAYGSNLNLEQMQHRCPTATVVGTSEIQDYTLVFRGSKSVSYATIEPQEGSVVPVLLWDIQPLDELKLDAYEGYPDFYYKDDLELNITLDNKKEKIPVNAMVYIMPNTFELGTPTKQYIKTIADGYTSANFDKDILYNALEQNENNIKLTDLANKVVDLANDYYTELDSEYRPLDRVPDMYLLLKNEDTQKITDFLSNVIENNNPKFTDIAENLLNKIEEINPNFNKEMEMRW